MNVQIVDSSPQVQSNEVKQRVRYPFADLEVGKSFTLAMGECNIHSLRTAVAQQNKKKDSTKHFTLITHKALKLYEVARTA